MSIASTPSAGDVQAIDRGYGAFLERVRERFAAALARDAGVLFQTDVSGLFEVYLDALPDQRQVHNCKSCRQFLEAYGGLVTIDAGGRTRSAFWDEPNFVVEGGAWPEFYRTAVARLCQRVERARITGVFLSSEPIWGKPVTGQWTHLAAEQPAELVHRDLLKTAGQAMAEKLEDFRTVSRALAEFPAELVAKAVTLLEAEALYRAEKVIGPAKWLANLHAVRACVRHNEARDNVVWRAIATSPAGFCHPRASMIGSLLEDLAAGMGFDEVARRFQQKMHPLQYQRPQAAPDAGNIARGEEIVAKLGLAPSLRRRYARLEEVEAIWRPRPEDPPRAAGGGVFAHLTPKGATPVKQVVPPPRTMTWVKFAAEVMPAAERIEFLVPGGRGSFLALVTAVDPEAPPILQWDREDRRNPVSHYVWHGGSFAEQWGLVHGRYCRVNALALHPQRWGQTPEEAARPSHHGDYVLLVLDGARETHVANLALFPECLRSELREVRSTIEAYSKSGRMEGREEATACGYALTKGDTWNAVVRVHSGGSYLDYRLDRWD